MLTAGTGCPRCSRARAAIRPADTETRAASGAPAARKISRDSRENSLRWRPNGAAKKGARRDARRPDRAKASRLDPCYIKFRAEIKDSYPDCDEEEEESEEEEENDDYVGGAAAGTAANEATRAVDTDGTTLAAPNADRRYVLATSDLMTTWERAAAWTKGARRCCSWR